MLSRLLIYKIHLYSFFLSLFKYFIYNRQPHLLFVKSNLADISIMVTKSVQEGHVVVISVLLT